MFNRGGIHHVRHFPCKFPHKWLLWNVHLHFDCAGSRKTRHLTQKSCQETSYRELVQRSCQETSYRDLANRALYRDLVQRSCQETSYRSYRVLVQRPGEESSDLSQRSFVWAWTEILLWGPSQRSSVAISYREISLRVLPLDLWESFCTEILPGHLLWRSCTETSHRDLLQRSCQEISGIHLS